MERQPDNKRPKFWERISERETVITPKTVETLEVGKHSTTSLTLRISAVNPVRVGATGTTYFRFTGRDATGALDVVCFGDVALTLAQFVKMNKVVMFTNLTVVMSGFSGNKELLLNKDTVYADVPAIENTPEPQWNFVDFKNLDPANPEADVLGVVVLIGDLVTGTKDGKEWKRRDITLLDRQSEEVIVAFWSQDAVNFNAKLYSTLAILKVHVGAHNGVVNASVRQSSTVWMDPELEIAKNLEQWFRAEAQRNGLAIE